MTNLFEKWAHEKFTTTPIHFDNNNIDAGSILH